MDVMGPLHRFDDYQQKRKWLALPVAVIKKFGDDQGGNLASLVAWYGFFSLFPLLLVFATILGYVLAGDPSTRQSVEHSVQSQFPAIGSSLPLKSISGSAFALAVGLPQALWAGPRGPSTRCGRSPTRTGRTSSSRACAASACWSSWACCSSPPRSPPEQ